MSLAAHHSYKITCYIYCMVPNEIQLQFQGNFITRTEMCTRLYNVAEKEEIFSARGELPNL